MAELKLCPFCGGRAMVELSFGSYYVVCTNGRRCAVKPRTWGFDTKDEAIKAWNRRAGEDG